MLSPHGHVHGQHFAWASAAPRTGVADARGRPTHSFRSSRHVHGRMGIDVCMCMRLGMCMAAHASHDTHSFRSSRHVMVSPIRGALDDCVCEGHRQQRMSGWSAWGRKKLPDARLRTLTLCAPPRISTEEAQSTHYYMSGQSL